jgi:hypothetical protein
MGYNRSGTRRTARLKRHKREMQRLAAKAEAQQAEGGQKEGLVAKVKHLAHDAAVKVGAVAKAAVEKVTGHKH